MNTLYKPRIKLYLYSNVVTNSIDRLWRCSHNTAQVSGFGKTPKESYIDWQFWNYP